MTRERLKQLAEEFPGGIYAEINAVLEKGVNEHNQRILLSAATLPEEFPDIFDFCVPQPPLQT
jgi:hypothetical protein